METKTLVGSVAGCRVFSRWAALLCVVWCLLTRVTEARATTDFSITWDAPAGCPDAATFKKRIDALVASETEAQNFVVRARTSEKDGLYHLALRVEEGRFHSNRTFSGSTCEEVVGAAAVSIALLMNTSSNRSEKSAADSPKDAPSPAVPVSPSERTQDKAPPVDTSRALAAPRVLILAPAGRLDWGLVDEVSLGWGAGVGLSWGPYRWLLDATWFPPQRLASTEYPATQARLQRVGFVLNSCRTWGRRLQWGACLDVALSLLHARAEGPEVVSRGQNSAWFSLGPSVLGRVPLGRFLAISAQVALHVQTARPRLIVDGQGELSQIGLLDLTTRLGAEWNF